MSDPFTIVKDSSIWRSSASQKATSRRDPYLRIGLVKRVVQTPGTTDLRYLVEIRDRSNAIEVNAIELRKFGGVYNYEDVVMRGYNINEAPDPAAFYKAKPGDMVLVGFLNGEAREAIILGGLLHSARQSDITVADGPVYKSMFNGVETSINKDGEYIITFRGQPTNIAKLSAAPTNAVESPAYDAAVGTSFFKFDKTGSYEVSDNAQSNVQNIRIDKPSGTLTISSGKIVLKMTKGTEVVDLTCKQSNTVATDKIDNKTKVYATEATTSAKIKSPKIAFGKSGVELLDQLAKLVDALGKVMPLSPVGPCSNLKSSPQWGGVEAVKAKIKEITGSL